MTHNQANYSQNYQNYYQSAIDPYVDYYDNENQNLDNFDDMPPDLQAPNPILYAEGYPVVTELYTGNTQFAESQQQMENPGIQFRQEYNSGHNEYCYTVPPHQRSHRTKVPKIQKAPLQSNSSYRYSLPHSLHTSCPLATSHSLQEPSLNLAENSYIPKVRASSLQGVAKSIPHYGGASNLQGVEENYNFQDYQDQYGDYDQNQRNYLTRDMYGDYCKGGKAGYMDQYESNQEMYFDFKAKKLSDYGYRVAKSGAVRKYPITVKTPKYVNKSIVAQPVHKRPSALCLPVVTQTDPGLVKRKSKTHHQSKRTYDQSEPLLQIPNDIPEDYSYPAHQMHSEGDFNQNLIGQGLDNLLEQFENKVVLNESQDTGDGEEGGMTDNKIKELSKFLKPRVPSSVKAKQEIIAKMKSNLNMSGEALQPKMQMSLDKLLNRLQKCEVSGSGEHLSEKSFKSQKEDVEVKSSKGKNVQHKSFNYETLTRKLSPSMEETDNKSKCLIDKPSTSLTTSLDHRKSLRSVKPLDDHCALDLHKSKSYIVDLIDRALSRELGTVPRTQSIKNDMTPKRAIATISKHRHSSHKELCYEVTAALTDSFISNVTAPPQKPDSEPGRSESCNFDAKKLRSSYSDEGNYIKQLKQLRWGHIRHIQHEARRLADLEEFLEKCGEMEFS